MYTASFGLCRAPFEDRADAAFFFPAAQHEEAIAAMQYEAQHGEGVGLVLGETGTGKTILMRALSRRLSNSGKVAVLTVPGNGAVDILRETCKAFGVSLPSSLQDARGLARLRRHLVRNGGQGGSPVLIIDQAEHLSPGDLMDVESLLELKDDRGRLLRIVLAAHVRFHELLAQPAFTRLRQLAFTEHRLGNFDESEVAQYIRHRLNVAGAAGGDIFSASAVERIYEKSHGVPRVINQLCNAAMLSAYGAGATHVTLEHIEGTSGQAALVEAPQFPTASWSHADGPYQDHGNEVHDHLTDLIQQAQRVMHGLDRRETQVASVVEHSERKVDQVLDNANERILTLESKLSAATRRAEQAASQLERAEHVFVRAEQLEARLTAFADQLAEQMDNVQTRVAAILNHAAPLDEARKGLEEAVRQSEAACGKMEKSSSRADALLLEQKEKVISEFQKAANASMETAAKKVRGFTEAIQKEVSVLLDQSGRSAKRLVAECHQNVAEAVEKAQGKIDASARFVTEQISQVETTTTAMHDAAEAGKRAIQELSQKTQRTEEELGQIIDLAKQEMVSVQQAADRIRIRTTDELKQAADQAMQEARNAHEAAERIRTLQRESAQVAARMAADTTAARGASESLGGLISTADAKIGQLASTHAASSHVHERLAKLVVTAHPMAERAEEAVEQLREQLGQSDKAQSQLFDKIQETTSKLAEVTVQFERVDHSAAESEKCSQNLKDAVQQAGEIQQKLEGTRAEASAERTSLQEWVAQSAGLLDRADSIKGVLADCNAASTSFGKIVASATSLTREIPILLEAAQEREQAMKALLDIHEKTHRDASEASERMAEHLQAFNETVQSSEGRLFEQRRCMDALEQEFRQVTERAGAAQEVASQVQSVVDSAQAQAENLERVCVAVRKVFSGLSQASLNARNQAQELDAFVSQASQTAHTFQQWLEQVRSRMDYVTEGSIPGSKTAVVRRADSSASTLEREAEMLVEDEPGAVNAHLLGGGLGAALGASHSSKAREIELLIEKARQSKTADSELEMAGRAGE